MEISPKLKMKYVNIVYKHTRKQVPKLIVLDLAASIFFWANKHLNQHNVYSSQRISYNTEKQKRWTGQECAIYLNEMLD